MTYHAPNYNSTLLIWVGGYPKWEYDGVTIWNFFASNSMGNHIQTYVQHLHLSRNGNIGSDTNHVSLPARLEAKLLAIH